MAKLINRLTILRLHWLNSFQKNIFSFEPTNIYKNLNDKRKN